MRWQADGEQPRRLRGWVVTTDDYEAECVASLAGSNISRSELVNAELIDLFRDFDLKCRGYLQRSLIDESMVADAVRSLECSKETDQTGSGISWEDCFLWKENGVCEGFWGKDRWACWQNCDSWSGCRHKKILAKFTGCFDFIRQVSRWWIFEERSIASEFQVIYILLLIL